MKKWRDKIQNVYSSYEEFQSYCEIYSIHKRLGYLSMETCWSDNPTAEGSVNPSDYGRVIEKGAAE